MTQKVLTKYFSIGLVVVISALLLWRHKSLFIAAMVNGQSIPRPLLEKRLVDRYGAQTLDEVINEELILQEGKAKGIMITDQEIADKVAEIDKSLGGKISLKDALAGQGLTMAEFQKQIKLQLTLEKLAGASVVVSEADISDYLGKNRATMTASDEAGLRTEAKNALTAQRKNENLRKIFQELKARAKIIRFL